MIRRIFGLKNEARSRKDYQDVTFLGRGSYGDVNKVKRIFDGALFAMKKTSPANETEKEKAMREGDILKYEHPYLVKYFQMFIEAECIHFVMELCSNGNLKEYISRNNLHPLSQSNICIWTCQLALGLEFLHWNKLVHRDIKEENILVNDKRECKLAGFGLLRDDCGSTTNMGTLRYCSPELVNDPNTFSDKSDIWALGIIVHNLCTNTHLFQGSLLAVLTSIEQYDKLPQIDKTMYTNTLQLIIDKTLSRESSSRWSALEMSQHILTECVLTECELNIPFDQWARLYQVACSGSNTTQSDTRRLSHSSANSDILLNIGARIKYNDGRTLLHHAIEEGKTEIVEKLIAQSPEFVNIKDKDGFTPIHLAMKGLHWDLIETLLVNGAALDGNKQLIEHVFISAIKEEKAL
jgi:serine/threonine protein kinase